MSQQIVHSTPVKTCIIENLHDVQVKLFSKNRKKGVFFEKTRKKGGFSKKKGKNRKKGGVRPLFYAFRVFI